MHALRLGCSCQPEPGLSPTPHRSAMGAGTRALASGSPQLWAGLQRPQGERDREGMVPCPGGSACLPTPRVPGFCGPGSQSQGTAPGPAQALCSHPGLAHSTARAGDLSRVLCWPCTACTHRTWCWASQGHAGLGGVGCALSSSLRPWSQQRQMWASPKVGGTQAGLQASH